MAVCNCPEIPVASQFVGGSGSETGEGISPTSPAISNPFTSSSGGGTEINIDINPIAFFVAPWHVIAAGAIPSVVQVVSGNNTTSSERWSVSISTSIVMGVRTVGFEGVSFFISFLRSIFGGDLVSTVFFWFLGPSQKGAELGSCSIRSV
jgi:hypothetical protein